MAARDFIEDTLLPWLEMELAEEVPGNKQMIAGFERAVKEMALFIERHRAEWDVEE